MLCYTVRQYGFILRSFLTFVFFISLSAHAQSSGRDLRPVLEHFPTLLRADQAAPTTQLVIDGHNLLPSFQHSPNLHTRLAIQATRAPFESVEIPVQSIDIGGGRRRLIANLPSLEPDYLVKIYVVNFDLRVGAFEYDFFELRFLGRGHSSAGGGQAQSRHAATLVGEFSESLNDYVVSAVVPGSREVYQKLLAGNRFMADFGTHQEPTQVVPYTYHTFPGGVREPVSYRVAFKGDFSSGGQIVPLNLVEPDSAAAPSAFEWTSSALNFARDGRVKVEFINDRFSHFALFNLGDLAREIDSGDLVRARVYTQKISTSDPNESPFNATVELVVVFKSGSDAFSIDLNIYNSDADNGAADHFFKRASVSAWTERNGQRTPYKFRKKEVVLDQQHGSHYREVVADNGRRLDLAPALSGAQSYHVFLEDMTMTFRFAIGLNLQEMEQTLRNPPVMLATSNRNLFPQDSYNLNWSRLSYAQYLPIEDISSRVSQSDIHRMARDSFQSFFQYGSLDDTASFRTDKVDDNYYNYTSGTSRLSAASGIMLDIIHPIVKVALSGMGPGSRNLFNAWEAHALAYYNRSIASMLRTETGEVTTLSHMLAKPRIQWSLGAYYTLAKGLPASYYNPNEALRASPNYEDLSAQCSYYDKLSEISSDARSHPRWFTSRFYPTLVAFNYGLQLREENMAELNQIAHSPGYRPISANTSFETYLQNMDSMFSRYKWGAIGYTLLGEMLQRRSRHLDRIAMLMDGYINADLPGPNVFYKLDNFTGNHLNDVHNGQNTGDLRNLLIDLNQLPDFTVPAHLIDPNDPNMFTNERIRERILFLSSNQRDLKLTNWEPIWISIAVGMLVRHYEHEPSLAGRINQLKTMLRDHTNLVTQHCEGDTDPMHCGIIESRRAPFSAIWTAPLLIENDRGERISIPKWIFHKHAREGSATFYLYQTAYPVHFFGSFYGQNRFWDKMLANVIDFSSEQIVGVQDGNGYNRIGDHVRFREVPYSILLSTL